MKKIGSILAAALVAVACSPENEGVQEASLEVSPSQLTFGAEDTALEPIHSRNIIKLQITDNHTQFGIHSKSKSF